MTRRADLARQGVTLTAAVAQAALPTLLTPSFADDEQPPDVMQPAPYTFSVWLPIFASSIAHGLSQARRARATDPVLRSTGWPLAAAFTATAAWAPLVATRRHWAAQAALVGVAVFGESARRRVAAADLAGDLSPGDRVTLLPSAALLSAWGGAAALVNMTAMLVDRDVVRTGRPATVLALSATVASGVLTTFITAATPGGRRSTAARAHAATTVWALTGIAAGQRKRSQPVAPRSRRSGSTDRRQRHDGPLRAETSSCFSTITLFVTRHRQSAFHRCTRRSQAVPWSSNPVSAH